MDYDTDSDTTATISHSNNFTPINSPKGKRIAQTNNVVMKTEESDQYPSPIKTEETMGDTLTPTKAPALAANKAENTPTGKSATVTPRKRGLKASGSATTTPNKNPKKDSGSTDDGEPSTPGSATTPSRATLPSIPVTLAAAGPEDRMILRLRDEENRPWTEINKIFVEATNIKVGGSTLRMRYTTMKANFVGISEEDEVRLMRIKKEIEEKFECEKWHRITEAIVQDGGAKYPAAALQKKFKELSKQLNGGAANGNDEK
ncbi:hypothetical protein ASPSYDRAFT_49271 [Aspergillus sydowii CBS 593.65]|uniref:Uncharacterized protein n=1 Tax=Aspergillus sydowii CBS 593.65 TaxID=1036612 RepID=A0A1L9T6N8_9EURO|nr:uncharacterized protein ASPSYDRAFT_49271 [Aspergillus sydowii CBS 593.65]OJJ55112.1 hypothetical protein ASPSYDRAFT_49271 [Aspergillus sydowii CBS 593.65]